MPRVLLFCWILSFYTSNFEVFLYVENIRTIINTKRKLVQILDVWCLGTIILKALSLSSSDADLLSLLNLMRLDCVSNRPAIVKLLQLTKNRLKDCEMVTKILKDLYKEILGDIDELVCEDSLLLIIIVILFFSDKR